MGKLLRYIRSMQNFRVTMLGILISTALIVSMNLKTQEALRENNTRYLLVLAKVIAIQFDARLLDEINRSEDVTSEAYRMTQEKLSSIMSQNPDIFSISIMVPSLDSQIFKYLANVHLFDRDVNNDSMISKEEEPIPPGKIQTFSKESPIHRSLLLPVTEEKIYPDTWGITRSAYAPIFDSGNGAFAILKIDISQKSYLQDIKATQFYFLLMWIGMISLVIFLSHLLVRGDKVRRHQEQTSKIKDEFISIASHELRTPMTVVQGYIDLILEGKYGIVNSELRNILKRILNNTDQLLNLINNLLDINQMELGRMKFKKEVFDVAQLVKEVGQDFDIITYKKNIGFTLMLPKQGNFTANADREKVRRVLANLIGNACKFTQVGGEIEVSIRSAEMPNFLQVSVRDNGPGIPKEQHGLIFEKFHQVENQMQKNFEGSGLGLSIVKAIVGGMGGKIWFESIPGKGSIFSFTLPQ